MKYRKKMEFGDLWEAIQNTSGLVLQPNMTEESNFVFTYNPHIEKVEFMTKLNDQFREELSRKDFEKVWEKFFKIPWIDLKTNTVSPHYVGNEVFIAGIIRYYEHWW